MSQNYTAQKLRQDSEGAEVQVCSKLCRYLVRINEDEIGLLGPGVSEKTEAFEDLDFGADEDLAIYVVLLFENGLWPED